MGLQTIEYKVQPHYALFTETAVKQKAISPLSQALLIGTAETINDTKLKRALLNLANRRSKTAE